MARNIFSSSISATANFPTKSYRREKKVEEGFGHSPVGRKAIEVIPSSIENGLSFCRTAAVMKMPIADIGRFSNANGAEIWYRSILLPLSSDQIRIDHVLGAFSFKVME